MVIRKLGFLGFQPVIISLTLLPFPNLSPIVFCIPISSIGEHEPENTTTKKFH
jgi:hypothetical protein